MRNGSLDIISSKTSKQLRPGLKLLKDIILAHKNLLIFAVVCLILGTAIDVGLVLVIQHLLDGMKIHLEYTSGASPLYIAAIVMFFVCCREAIGFMQNNRLALLTYNIGASLKNKIVLAHRAISFTAITKVSKNHILVLFRNVDDVVDFTKQVFIVVIREFMTLIGTVIAMLYLNYKLALAFLLITPFAFSIIKTMSKRSKKSAEQSLLARNLLNQHVLHGHEHWIAFHTNRLARDEYLSKLSRLLASYKNHGISLTMASVWLSMITQFWIGLMLGAIVYLMLSGAMGATVGTMTAFLYAVARLRSPAKRIADLRSVYDPAVASIDAIYKFVSQEKEFSFYHQARALEWQTLSLESVQYKKLFQGLNCHFNIRDKVLISGVSGIGKSTLLHMLALLIKPSSGSIKIDEQVLDQDMQESWFESMVYVDQFSGLLSASMRDNLTAFAIADDAKCQQVLELAGLENWLQKNSLDTNIGDGGVPLSGGERQRVILARIMLQCSNKSVVLLDEVFASLDAVGGYKLTNILLDYLKDSLVIAVSHKLNTYELFDRILMLNNTGLQEVTHANYKKLQTEQNDMAQNHKQLSGSDRASVATT